MEPDALAVAKSKHQNSGQYFYVMLNRVKVTVRLITECQCVVVKFNVYGFDCHTVSYRRYPYYRP